VRTRSDPPIDFRSPPTEVTAATCKVPVLIYPSSSEMQNKRTKDVGKKKKWKKRRAIEGRERTRVS